MMSFPFFSFSKNTICSDMSLDKTLNIVYNEFARRSPTKNGEGWFFYTLRGARGRMRYHKDENKRKERIRI